MGVWSYDYYLKILLLVLKKLIYAAFRDWIINKNRLSRVFLLYFWYNWIYNGSIRNKITRNDVNSLLFSLIATLLTMKNFIVYYNA